MKPEKNLVEHATWSASGLGPDLQHIMEAHHHDPFAALGRHNHNGGHSDLDLHLFGEGKHEHVYRILGAHTWAADGVPGVLFATWAPHAERVSVVGDFNDRYFEVPPATASIVVGDPHHSWRDGRWLSERRSGDHFRWVASSSNPLPRPEGPRPWPNR